MQDKTIKCMANYHFDVYCLYGIFYVYNMLYFCLAFRVQVQIQFLWNKSEKEC